MVINNIKKIIFVIFLSVIVFIPNFCFAGALNPSMYVDQETPLAPLKTNTYNANTSIGDIMATIIKAFIGLLGIIFIVLIVYAGYSWLTAAGDEAKVTKAKETLQRAVIGLVIVLAAYSITYFVFSNLSNLNSPGGPTAGPIP